MSSTPEQATAVERFLTPQRRQYVYTLVGALVPLLVAVGVVTQGLAALILNVAAAVLAIGGSTLAYRHVVTD